jgi:hypothetical protein
LFLLLLVFGDSERLLLPLSPEAEAVQGVSIGQWPALAMTKQEPPWVD